MWQALEYEQNFTFGGGHFVSPLFPDFFDSCSPAFAIHLTVLEIGSWHHSCCLTCLVDCKARQSLWLRYEQNRDAMYDV